MANGTVYLRGSNHRTKVVEGKRIRFDRRGKPVQLGEVEGCDDQLVVLAGMFCADGSRLKKGASRPVTPAARMIVGLDRGIDDPNCHGRCAQKHVKFTRAEVDSAVRQRREAQVESWNVGLTRYAGNGWFRNKPENANEYLFLAIPAEEEPSKNAPPDFEPDLLRDKHGDPVEATWEQFQDNIRRLASHVGKEFCQDAIYVTFDDGSQRSTEKAVWYK